MGSEMCIRDSKGIVKAYNVKKAVENLPPPQPKTLSTLITQARQVVRKAKARGYNDEQIMKMFIAKGWSNEDIKKIL